MTGPRHIPFEAWQDDCYNQIARLSFAAGLTLQDVRSDAVLVERLKANITFDSADVIPFPCKSLRETR